MKNESPADERSSHPIQLVFRKSEGAGGVSLLEWIQNND